MTIYGYSGKTRRAFVERVCELCGKPFLIRADYAAHGMGRGCSKPCRALIGMGLKTRQPKVHKYRYIYLPEHPRAAKGKRWRGYVREHIVVAEHSLGRSLLPWEIVHHLNGNKLDNRPENLEVMSARRHVRLHGVRGFTPCRFCGKI